MTSNDQVSNMPKMIDNINQRLRDDLKNTITKKSKLKIAAAFATTCNLKNNSIPCVSCAALITSPSKTSANSSINP